MGDQDPTAVAATGTDDQPLLSTGDDSAPPQDDAQGDAAATASSGDTAQQPSQPRRKQRDILRETRKELSLERTSRLRAEQQVQNLSSTVQRLEEQLNRLNQNFTAQQRRQMEEELSQLPPEERLERRIEMMEAKVGQALQHRDQPPPRPAAEPSPAEVQAAIRRRAQELLVVINNDYGLLGDEKIDLNAEGLDFTTEARFVASAGLLAQKRLQELEDEEESSVPTKKNEGAGNAPAKTSAEDREALKAEVKKEVMRELGISRPNSPAAAPRSSGRPVTTEDFMKIGESFDSRKGFKSIREQFKELNRAAQEQAHEYLRSGKPTLV